MKVIVILTFILSFSSCISQSRGDVINITAKSDLNYILSNIYPSEIMEEKLFKGGMFVKIFKISDSKATPERYFKGSDEVLESMLISIRPDGDYYTTSLLYKVEALLNCKIIKIDEKNYPNFILHVEHGPTNDRKTKLFEIKGVIDE